MKILRKFPVSVRAIGRRNFLCVDNQAGSIDPKTNILYGGDLPTSISDKSVGSILFNRMLRMDRREEIFQICSSTKIAMTTRECLQKTVALAEKLKEIGIQKGDFIMLVGNNSLYMNIAWMGIIFAGAVPVPINCKIGFYEIEIIARSLRPKLFGCDAKYLYLFEKILNSVPELASSKIFLLGKQRVKNRPNIMTFGNIPKRRGQDFESFQPSQVDNAEEELVLGLKAPGSLGRIIGITHRNANAIIAQNDSLGIDHRLRKEIILMVTKLFWASGFYPLLTACCYGSRVIVMRSFDEENFLKTVSDYKVTTAYLYSSKCWELYKHTPEGKYDLSSCKEVYSDDGPLALPRTLLDGWKEKFGINLRPLYGIPEIAGFALKPYVDDYSKNSSGKLVPTIYAKVIGFKSSENLGPLETGEICFKGPLVSKGYINDRRANKLIFDSEGFLRTGYSGYYDADRDFFVIDTVINQISYKAYKISPRELEGIIKTLEFVKDVCVTGIHHPEDGEHPVAFVVIKKPNSKEITEKHILDFVNAQVAGYKRIKAVVFLTKIPKFRGTGAIKRHLFSEILAKYRMKKGGE